jgi:uncharacterized caspase-like protein
MSRNKFSPTRTAMPKRFQNIKSMAWMGALLCASVPYAALGQTKATPTAARADNRNLLVQAAQPISNQKQNRRVALVMGNSAYKDAPLTNPVNDARAIANALRESGFSVTLRENTDQRGMLSALREFGDQLRGGGTGLFYYAGHGMQIKGRNYLIPVGASIDREDEVAYSAVDAQAVLDKMEAAGNMANIMILDACRNNPFVRSTRSGQAGLAQMDAPVGTLVAYATSPGSVASDGVGLNGLYTQHLLAAIRKPGNKVEDVFKQVRANVRRDSSGKQVPWESTSLEGDFYFQGGAPTLSQVPPPASQVATQAAVDAGLDAALWDAVKASTLAIEIRAYLNRYPQGKFAAEARARLAQLQPAPAVTAAVAQPARPTQPAPVLAPSVASAAAVPHVKFAVGDSWSFANDNLLTKKQSTYTQKVTALAEDGDAVMNDGDLIYSRTARPKFIRNANSERQFSDGFESLPSQLRKGFKESTRYEVTSRLKDGRETKITATGSLESVRQEKVVTPAGEFKAWRVERIARSTNQLGEETDLSHIFWFVPELKRLVAQDLTETSVKSGKVTLRERVALQSFVLANVADVAALSANWSFAHRETTSADFVRPMEPDDQVEVDKRTADILATLATAPGPGRLVKPADSTKVNAGQSSNSAGFVVGDRWRYQKVDKFKQEVVDNWVRNIEAFNSDGSIKLNDGRIQWTADGGISSIVGGDGSRTSYSPSYKWLPSSLKVGHNEPIKYAMTWRRADGVNGAEEHEGKVKVLAQERVKVPAGEFDAWKIEVSMWVNGKNLSSSTNYVNQINEVLWYVPALRNFVASEYEKRGQNGNVQSYDRHELTSFSVRGADHLAQR